MYITDNPPVSQSTSPSSTTNQDPAPASNTTPTQTSTDPAASLSIVDNNTVDITI